MENLVLTIRELSESSRQQDLINASHKIRRSAQPNVQSVNSTTVTRYINELITQKDTSELNARKESVNSASMDKNMNKLSTQKYTSGLNGEKHKIVMGEELRKL
ncbi:uncharacterized protein LOC126235202 [Schistocerca nitens]|uniref:uncharacterized protein LOC126199553 n=1 Tax=Schistocerca nitens TaxID=7011 RepID=UPI0021187F67|nr:uncharacterized protein LOC126199553 [Schistocerca nitens]XP_049799889.1 uncharacterized protein LOC126235202 [Schistocerca nitens]